MKNPKEAPARAVIDGSSAAARKVDYILRLGSRFKIEMSHSGSSRVTTGEW